MDVYESSDFAKRKIPTGPNAVRGATCKPNFAVYGALKSTWGALPAGVWAGVTHKWRKRGGKKVAARGGPTP